MGGRKVENPRRISFWLGEGDNQINAEAVGTQGSHPLGRAGVFCPRKDGMRTKVLDNSTKRDAGSPGGAPFCVVAAERIDVDPLTNEGIG